MSDPRPAAAPVRHARPALTTAELLAEGIGTVTRLRWVLEVTLERALPEHVDPRDGAALAAWLHLQPPAPAVPDPAEELARILARGRAERPPREKAWVPCDGVQPRHARRWVEVDVPVLR